MGEEVRPRQLTRLERGRIQQVGLGLVVEFRREQELADLTVRATEIRVARRARAAPTVSEA